MSMEQVTGYIVNISPKRKCNSVEPMFDVILQNEPSGVTEINGFGNDAYSKLSYYHKAKSPVKLQMVKNAKYRKPSFNKRCLLEPATIQEVPFNIDNSMVAGSSMSGVAQESKEETITNIKAEANTTAYYTVAAKIRVGSGPTKTIGDGKMLKDDISLHDKTDSIDLTMWGKQWEAVETGQMVKMSHLRFRVYNKQVHLTTSPLTNIDSVDNDENIVIPDGVDKEPTTTIQIKGIEDVGLLNQYSKCTVCQHKVKDSDVRKNAFTCTYCRKTRGVNKLQATYVIDVQIKDNSGQLITLLLHKEVAEPILSIFDGQEVADELTTLNGFTIVYNIQTNAIKDIIKKV